MTHYSRATQEQITSRVTKAGFVFDRTWKCFLCGKTYLGRDCPHTQEENEEIILTVQKKSA